MYAVLQNSKYFPSSGFFQSAIPIFKGRLNVSCEQSPPQVLEFSVNPANHSPPISLSCSTTRQTPEAFSAGQVIVLCGAPHNGLTLTVERVMEYESPYDFIAAIALDWYPERKKEEIKKLWIAG